MPLPGKSPLLLDRRGLLAAGLGALASAALPRAARAAPPRRTRLLLVFLEGGPSHLDTWDPKPGAPAEIRGEFAAIPTSVPGLRICEHLPRTARLMHHVALVRSVTHAETDHARATQLMASGAAGLIPARLGEFVRHPSPFGGGVGGGVPERQAATANHVEIRTLGGWDTHGRCFAQLRDRLLPEFDAFFSGLLRDLAASGRLEETLVVCMGEFGRSPRVNACGGRDHWPRAQSVLLAGGGIRGGQLVGATDRRGEEVVERPVSPADLWATVRQALGLPAPPAGTPVRELF